MVSLHGCPDYAPEHVEAALAACLADIGGWAPYVAPGETVLLKVNLVSACEPSLGATTHPAFVSAVAKSLLAYGARVLIGDSPGGSFNAAHLKRVYRVCGMETAAEESGAELVFDTDVAEVDNPSGRLLQHLNITHMIAAADKVISLAKIKTHAMMTYTGVTKNLFGAIPGTEKAELHMRMPEAMDFADALLDIYLAAHPVLCLMDGILGMEGNGPTGGSPREIGVVMASPSGPELDLVAASLIGLSADAVPLLKQAVSRRMIPQKASEITLLGESPEDYRIPDFKMPDHINANLIGWFPRLTRKLSARLLRPRVQFDPDICVGCGECAANCPAQVITMKADENGRRHPHVDYEHCIRCYCCQELCPRNAVSIRQPLAFRVANKL